MSAAAPPLPFANLPIAAPLAMDADGVVRVSGTRVPLDAIIAAYQDGDDADEIAQQYPPIPLADVHAVISLYLRHRLDVDRYLEQRRAAAKAIREDTERHFDPIGVRERLLQRKRPS